MWFLAPRKTGAAGVERRLPDPSLLPFPLPLRERFDEFERKDWPDTADLKDVTEESLEDDLVLVLPRTDFSDDRPRELFLELFLELFPEEAAEALEEAREFLEDFDE